MCQGLSDEILPSLRWIVARWTKIEFVDLLNVFTEIISAADVDLFLQVTVTSHLHPVLGPRVLRK